METKTFELNLTGFTQAQIDSIKSQIEKFEEENKRPKKLTYGELQNGYVVKNGIIAKSENYRSEVNELTNSIGLWRPTREECEKLLKKMQIAERLRQWSLMCEEKVDWKDDAQCKHYISCYNNEIRISVTKCIIDVHICFSDRSVLQRAIADIGEKKLIEEYFVEV